MDEQIVYKGEWFIPDVSKINLFGTLKIKQHKQITLELICPRNLVTKFLNSNTIPFPIKIDIVCGISQSKNITLLNCESLFFNMLHDPIVIELIPDIVFVGKKFTKIAKPSFINITADISYLEKWVNNYNIDIKEPTSNSIKLTYRKPKDVIVYLGKGFKVFICNEFYRNVTGSGEVNLSSKPYLKIETRKERIFDDFISILYLFQKLLVLAILEPVYLLSMKGITKDKELIEIYYAINHDSLEIKSETPNILFNLGTISKDLKIIFKNIIEKDDALEAVFAIYLGTIYTTRKNLENWFSNLITAIEAFHRRIIGGSYQDREEYLNTLYIRLIEAIPEDIDKNYKEALQNKMIFLYEYSLRKRLKDLMNIMPKRIKKSLYGDYNKGDFINTIVDIRNYLVHYEKNKDNKLDIRKTYHLAKRLRILLHLLLLNEIGINIEKIEWRKLR